MVIPSSMRTDNHVESSINHSSEAVEPQLSVNNSPMNAAINDEIYEDLSAPRHSRCPHCNQTLRSSDDEEKMGHPYKNGPPGRIGLYDPSLEKDACGVGMIVHIKRQESHQLVRDALDILERLAHRGACGCDPKTGDGSGILTGLPDKFFRRILRQEYGVDLPPAGRYAVGLCFLSKNWDERQKVKVWVESVVAEHGARVICWRTVPCDNSGLGPGSKSNEPHMEQIFITADSNSMIHYEGSGKIQQGQHLDKRAFNMLLYVIRKKLGHGSERHGPPPGRIYVCSLSSVLIVYKGQLTPEQLAHYFTDLGQDDFETHLALVHSRFSTNTFPSWERAQPLRVIAHNGEINTLKGNSNWMASRQGKLRAVGEDIGASILDNNISSIGPVVEAGVSDSGAIDNALELMVSAGRPIEEALCMLIPEPWQNHAAMDPQRRAMYEFFSNKMEPWDGPALVAFTDGHKIGATLDRNGLRPGRVIVTKDDRAVLSSEVGVLPSLPDSQVAYKSRLIPGEIFMVNLDEERIVPDSEIKRYLSQRLPYAQWLAAHKVELSAVVAAQERSGHRRNEKIRNDTDDTSINVPTGKTTELERLKLFGYTQELISMIVGPMGTEAMEMLGSMGNDQALTFLSMKPRHPYDYFQQMFAQVTNPPIDPIRESIVMTLTCPVGPEANLLEFRPTDCARMALAHPVLRPAEFYALTHLPNRKTWRPRYLDMTFPVSDGPDGLKKAVERICDEAVEAVQKGTPLLVLTDRAVGQERVPVFSMMAVGAVHHRLVKEGMRTLSAIVVESGDACEVHHMCLLTGFGADAIYPWGAYTAIRRFHTEQTRDEGATEVPSTTAVDKKLPFVKLVNNYAKAAEKGILKVMAKMGISTLASYKGAQIFEAVGIAQDVIDVCFVGCPSRIGGISWDVFGADLLELHREAYPPTSIQTALIQSSLLKNNGDYHWRSGQRGEKHLNHPDAVAKLQEAARYNSRKAYKQFADISNAMAQKTTLRGQFELRKDTQSIPLSEVEPVENIIKRFATGAMSYGSISIESHSTLAIAMNQVGGKSNTGEGGEHMSRYERLPNGESARSAIKQVASGRFGVTSYYLTNSDEIQIKMAQGAKPGEGGELPGYKVVGEIAKTRMTTAGVGLISPPPHHDIYSIEDLAQLIFDLKNANPRARISVKLVSEVGVGIVASGVTKGKADHILISGHDGGTGASKWTGIKHAGLPWELGLAETHQTLVLNGLRSRVVVQTDGQLKTGLDIIKAALLGAEEFCMATSPLIALGCIMMRKCHLNTCPVGIATQDPELRAMFAGQPEHVVNYLWMICEEAREYMAQLGIRKFHDLVGRVDLMVPSKDLAHKHMNLDLSVMLVSAKELNPDCEQYCIEENKVDLDPVLDTKIWKRIQDKVEKKQRVKASYKIHNIDRAVGTLLSHHVSKLHGFEGLPENTLHLRFRGSAGQSFGAWLAKGLTLELNGDANDYVGKGLSGGHLIIYPPKDSSFKAEDNVIVGNVCFYGATGGSAYIRGRALQRFCVRNSGANVVVEGVGDHGCEYMTGGTMVCLGPTGRNFAAGMSGGVAYVYDPENRFPPNCNRGLVQLEKLVEEVDIAELEALLENHRQYTGSAIADRLLWQWPEPTKHFIKIIPTEYKEVLQKKKTKEREMQKTKESQPQMEDKKESHPPAVEKPQQEGKEKDSVGFGETEGKSHEENISRKDQRFGTGVESAPSAEPKEEGQADSFGKQKRQGVKSNNTRAHITLSNQVEETDDVDMYGAAPTEAILKKHAPAQQLQQQPTSATANGVPSEYRYDGDWYAAYQRNDAIIRAEEMNRKLQNLRLDGNTRPQLYAQPTAAMASASASIPSDTDSNSSSSTSSDNEVLSPKSDESNSNKCGCGKTGGCGGGATSLSMNHTAGAASAGGIGGGGVKGQDIEESGPMDKEKGGKHKRPIVVDKPQKKRGFIEYERGALKYRPAKDRIHDWHEIYDKRDEKVLATQAARCMDCGIPFCHDSETHGCPLANKIPEWNQLVFEGKWKSALDRLLDTNNFPEFTGRICPAPCEGSCVLGIIESPVTIKNIEVAIIDHAWEQGWIKPKPPKTRTNKRVAVIGTGPAGLAAADQLNKVGHHVTVYERADRTGGLLMYGVPNMKLDKHGVVDRRVDIMREEGVEVVTNAHIGSSDNPEYSVKHILDKFDAVVLALGATKPRDLPIEGRKLKGIYFAMEFLYASTKTLLDNDQKYGDKDHIDAKDKNVIVIGGGDTGNDCIGTAVRMGAKSVVNFELLPQPPETRGPGNPWPQWPRIYRVDYGHEEVTAKQGKDPREFSIMSKRFIGDKSGEKLVGVETVQIQWDKNDAGEWQMKEIEGSNKVWDADLVFLSMGFTGPETPITQELNCDLDGRGNIRADRVNYKTSVGKVFGCGDARRGQSLIVHAIAEGRQCAREVDRFLSKKTYLP